MLHISFKVISLLVLEKKIFKVFTIYGHSSHVGHVTQLICINFNCLFDLKLLYELWFLIAIQVLTLKSE